MFSLKIFLSFLSIDIHSHSISMVLYLKWEIYRNVRLHDFFFFVFSMSLNIVFEQCWQHILVVNKIKQHNNTSPYEMFVLHLDHINHLMSFNYWCKVATQPVQKLNQNMHEAAHFITLKDSYKVFNSSMSLIPLKYIKLGKRPVSSVD